MSKKKVVQNAEVAHQKIDGRPPKKAKANAKVRIVLEVMVPTVFLLLAFYYCRNIVQREKLLKRPDVLLDYSSFKVQYPRLREVSLVEDTRRHLLFTVDLTSVGLHNIGYLSGRHTYLLGQSPFKSDRTIMEQRDILGQLEEFNLTQIMLNLNMVDPEPIDIPVGHPPKSRASLREKSDEELEASIRPRPKRHGRSVPDYTTDPDTNPEPAPIEHDPLDIPVGHPPKSRASLREKSEEELEASIRPRPKRQGRSVPDYTTDSDTNPEPVPIERGPLDIPVSRPLFGSAALKEEKPKKSRFRTAMLNLNKVDPKPIDIPAGHPPKCRATLREKSEEELEASIRPRPKRHRRSADTNPEPAPIEHDPLDVPVSRPLFGSAAVREEKPKKSRLRTANKVSQWMTRTIQSDAHFEIPNYPLDAQPDPDSITHIDADLRYCSKDIHDQSSCGACYAFSWNSFAEWHYCKQSGRQIDFSEQHMIDCGHLAAPGLYGCREGYLPDAKQFTQKFGFHLEEDYPYKGKQASSCTKASGTIKAKVVEFTRVQVIREEFEEILKEQPIVVQVHLPKDVMSYQQGIHPGSNCDKSMGHGMLLVGHGRDEGSPYWLLKNSMGSNWGENGYLRLSRDAPIAQCFGTGFIAKFKFESLDQDAYLDFYDNLKFQPSEHIITKPVINKGAIDWLNGRR